MCGITGIVNFGHEDSNEAKARIRKMVERIEHRGPDGFGFFESPHAYLGHARLSIIDIDGGAQPIHNEDQTIQLVFNGEIFNYVELREQLIELGYRFYTSTDTEVIVHLYEEYGLDFPNYLNGQFAIAIWDSSKELFLLCRDRVGIAPLYYSVIDNRMVFGSEIKAMLPGMKNTPSVNLEALDELMTFWAPAAPNTLFEGINELPPGKLLTFTKNDLKIQTYWDWQFPTSSDEYHRNSEEELSEELYDILKDATRLRLRSDVPVGAYLSGGLDSSTLVSVISEFKDTQLRTFSIGFDSENHDESYYQKLMINQLNTDHSSIVCRDSDIADNFRKTIWHAEMPILRTAPVPMGLLSGLVRDNGYKVVLTGEGADEVLGGYDLFKENKIRQFWAKNTDSSFRPALLKRLYPYLDVSPGQAQDYLKRFFGSDLENFDKACFSHAPRWTTTSKIKTFLSQDVQQQLKEDPEARLERALPKNLKEWHYFNRSQYLEAKTLMNGYLLSAQGDRMLMSNSVEGRFPFLDHRLIEFANKLHPKLKMKALNEKYLLKKAMAQHLPNEIVNRHKQPYRAPDIPSFFTGETPEYVEEALSHDAIAKTNIFDPKRVEMLVKKIRKGRAIGYKDNMALVGILSTQIWHSFFFN